MKLEAYARGSAEAVRAGPRRWYGDAESQAAAFLRKRALAERHGARLVLVVPPVASRAFAPLPEAGIALVDFWIRSATRRSSSRPRSARTAGT